VLFRVIDTTESQLATSSPAVEPLTLDEVKLQRRFSTTSLDSLFTTYIAAARQLFEEATGVQLIMATWAYWLDAFPCALGLTNALQIELPHPPLQAVLSVKYDDATGAEQTLDPATYRVIQPGGMYPQRARIVPVINVQWPIAACQPKAVRIEFTAGFGDTADSVPPLAKYALMMLVGHFHKFAEEIQDENRARITQLPIGAATVIDAYKKSAVQTLVPRHHGYFGYGDYGRVWG